MAIKVRKQAAASVEVPPSTHVQFFVGPDGIPQLKDSFDNVLPVAPPVEQTIEPSAWVTEMGSARINITAPGTYTVIPSPPAGKLRMVIDGPLGGMLSASPANQAAPCGLLLWASNGTLMGPPSGFAGTFDLTVQAQGRVLGPIGLTGEFSMSGGEYGAFYLAPGETVAVTVSNFLGGTTKVVGRATWIDFDATDVSFVRLTFPTVGVPQLVIPPVPTGKIAAMYFPGGAHILRDVSQYNQLAFFNNLDANTHNWNVTYTDPAGGSITTPSIGLPAGLYSFSGLLQYHSMVFVEGQSLSVALNSGDTVPSTPPYMWAMYKLYDSV